MINALNGMTKAAEFAGEAMVNIMLLALLIRNQLAENFKYSIVRVYFIRPLKKI